MKKASQTLYRTAIILSLPLTSVSAAAQDDEGWWAPPRGTIRIFHDDYNHNPINVYTIPIDGISHGGYTVHNSTTVIGWLRTECDGSRTQVGRIYPHTHYDEYSGSCD